MNYFNLLKFAQIDVFLEQKGFDSQLINQVRLAPKDIKRQVAKLFDTKAIVTEADIQNILQSTTTTIAPQKTNPLVAIFKNQPYTEEQFFKQIPEGYKKYITKILLNHEVKPEDLHTLLENITHFEKLKKKTELPIDRDINNYQSYRQLIETLTIFTEGKYKENPRLKVDPRNLEGAELVSTQGRFNIWKVTDAESLKQFGEGTKWCTRGSYKPKSRAEEYLKDYGSIFIVTNGPNLAYQFTSQLDEFQDVNNLTVKTPLPINVDFLVRAAVKENGDALLYASEELKNDPQFVLDAVKQNGYALQYVSEEFKNNPKIVLEAVKQQGNALQYASEQLKNDPQIALEAVKQNGYALYHASEEFKNNPQIVIEAVKQNGYALSYASAALKNNPQIVLEAVKQNGHALQYPSEELRNNPKIVLEAVKQDGHAWVYASEELKNNADFMKQVEQITKKACGWYSTVKYASCHGICS